ncbi:MAG: ribonuclease PH [Propionibacteriaceae bacterium]|jgi:hypothetical protein|nr:ribonuclease PH [Propionibacteriaceae bacterium]
MKRYKVIKKLKDEAKRLGIPFQMTELSKHTGIEIGATRSTLSRSSSDFPDQTAHDFWDQFAVELGGKGWWRS